MWLIMFLTIGHSGLSPQVAASHHQNPSVPRVKCCGRIQANGHLRGGHAASLAVLPGARTRRWCRSPSPLLSPRGPVQDTHVLLLPLLLEGQPATQKGCVGVGVWEVFQGHQLVPAGHPHPTHTPWGAEPPSQLSTTLGGWPGVQPQVAAAKCCCRRRRRRRCRRRRWKDTEGSTGSRASPHCSFSRNPSSEEAAAHHLPAPSA